MARALLSPLLQQIRRLVEDQRLREAPDQELLRLFQTGRDEAAFRVLLRRHGPMVFDVCRAVLSSEADAEDAFQATFLALVRNAASIRRSASLGSWLYGVAYRTALKTRAKEEKRRQHESHVPERSAPLAENLTWVEAQRALHEELNSLAERYRAPLVLCYLQGKTQDQAAVQLGLSKGTLRRRLEQGRALLRTRLVRRGLGPAAALVATAWPAATASAVPATLVAATAKAASQMVTGHVVASVILGKTALAAGVVQAMLPTKVKIAAAVLVTFGLLSVASGVWAYRTLAVQAAEVLPDQPCLLAVEQPSQSEPNDANKPGPAKGAAMKDRHMKDRQHQIVKEVVTKSFKTGRSPRLVVELYNGGIDLVANADGMVEVRVTKQGLGETDEATQAALKNVDVTMAQDGETVHITARCLEKNKKTYSAAPAEIRVPPAALLELHTSNGAVTLQGGIGKAEVQTSSGKIQVKERQGSLNLTAGNGPITVMGGTGQLDLKAGNGGITIQADKAEVTARTENGSIQFRGSLARGEHSFHTSNGSIVLALPADARFRFEAETRLGQIMDEFSEHQPRDKKRTHRTGTVGKSPSISIKLHTSNGNISLRPQEASE